MRIAGSAIHVEPRRATPPLPSPPPEDAVKSCGPTTVPPPANVAAGLNESTSQRPPIFFIVPVYWIESDFERREGIISSNSTSLFEAKSTVQLWKLVPPAG